MAKIQGIGFGFIPEETSHHFLVKIPRSQQEKVQVFERFHWDDGEQKTDMNYENTKVIISRYKWDLVKDAIQNELNNTLKEDNTIVGRFKVGDEIPVERLLGKEMVLLLWAIEDSDPSLIPVAIRNWLGFSREERWWLFTMTNATTGHADDKRGWRKAIRYAITENPIDDKKQITLFDL